MQRVHVRAVCPSIDIQIVAVTFIESVVMSEMGLDICKCAPLIIRSDKPHLGATKFPGVAVGLASHLGIDCCYAMLLCDSDIVTDGLVTHGDSLTDVGDIHDKPSLALRWLSLLFP
jgi:hypothetical protein